MARRRKPNAEGGVNLDSLMDALTNVVAVLILVLVLVQMDVTQKVFEFMENLQPATPEQVAQSMKELQEVIDLVKKKEALLTEDPPTREEIEEEKRQLALLEKDAKINEDLLADLDALQSLERKLRLEKDIEEAETNRLQKEIAKLEAQLDATPILVSTPAEVTIPSSRPIPSNADLYYALVFNDRVHLIDPYTPANLFMEEFNKHKNDWLLNRITTKGRDRYIYDATKIVAHFKNFDFKNSRGQEVRVVHNPTQTRIHLEVKPDRAMGGTSLEELADRNNKFNRIMMSVSQNRQAVLMFWVNPSSFNTYLRARPYADQNHVAAGWEVRGNESYWIPLTDFEVKRLKTPPPPPAIPPKPGPPGIKPTLD